MIRVDREPYTFEHPGLEFFMLRGRLAVRIGRRGTAAPIATFYASEPFPVGWELVARAWLARNGVTP